MTRPSRTGSSKLHSAAGVQKRPVRRRGGRAAKAAAQPPAINKLPTELRVAVGNLLSAPDLAALGATCGEWHATVDEMWQPRYAFSLCHREATTPFAWGQAVHEKERIQAAIFRPCKSSAEIRAQALQRAKRLNDESFQMVALQSAPPEDYFSEWAIQFTLDTLLDAERFVDAVAFCRVMPRPYSRETLESVVRLMAVTQDDSLLIQCSSLPADLIARFLVDILHEDITLRLETCEAVCTGDLSALDDAAYASLVVCMQFVSEQSAVALIEKANVRIVESFLSQSHESEISLSVLQAVLPYVSDVHNIDGLNTVLAAMHEHAPALFAVHALQRLGSVWMHHPGDNHAVTEAICALGFNINQPFADGSLPLGNAARNGDKDFARVLLAHGASPVVTDFSALPLHRLIEDDLELSLLFHAHGAPLPENALRLWVNNPLPDSSTSLKVLFNAGLRFDAHLSASALNDLATILDGCEFEEQRVLLGILVEMGVCGEAADDKVVYALKNALSYDKRIVELLIESGFSVHAYDNEARTVLHFAYIDSPALPILAAAGACLVQRDSNGELGVRLRPQHRLAAFLGNARQTLRRAGFAADDVEAWCEVHGRRLAPGASWRSRGDSIETVELPLF